MAVLSWAVGGVGVQSCRLRALKHRRGPNRTIVALANKLARIAWQVLAKDTEFQLDRAFAPNT